MKYSTAFRDSILRKVLPPESRSIGQVAQESSLSQVTIRNWLSKLGNGTLRQAEGETSPGGKSAVEKFRLLIESKQILEADRGVWLRERGLHDEHLPLFEQELVGLVSKNSDQARKELRELKKENAGLKTELLRKDKALAEVTALLVLKKKVDAIWGEREEDSSQSKNAI